MVIVAKSGAAAAVFCIQAISRHDYGCPPPQKSRGPHRLHRWGSMNSPFFLVCDDDVTELI
jgi:hypothetical protein